MGSEICIRDRVSSTSVASIATKNIGLFAIAGIMFWLGGYNLAYGIPEGGYIGSFVPWSDGSKLDTGYSDGSDWFFQMVFCATTVSIVSGALAERIKKRESVNIIIIFI